MLAAMQHTAKQYMPHRLTLLKAVFRPRVYARKSNDFQRKSIACPANAGSLCPQARNEGRIHLGRVNSNC